MSQFHDSPEKITWWDDPQTGQLSLDERKVIAAQASNWFVTRDETGKRKQAQLLTWALLSRHHLPAYVATAEVEAEINNANLIAPSGALESPTAWEKVTKHPLAIVSSAIVATASIVWAVTYNTRVAPADQHIKILEEQVAILKLQLETEKSSKATHSAARHAEASLKKKASR